MTEREKMLAGLYYDPYDDEISRHFMRARWLCRELELTPFEDSAERERIAKELIGKCGRHILLGVGFYCDYGVNIEVGENFYCNYGVCILDAGRVVIGDNCMIAPQVGIYTACHPLDRAERISGLEYTKPVTIGNDCWIGGHAVINPGVTLGDNVVVGSGSVVTKSFPSNVVIAGNPARVIRNI